MKKFLALLGATSLSIIAGTSVISCVKYQQSKPRFSNFTSINNDSWSLKTKKFTSSEINGQTPGVETAIDQTSYLYYSILNDFKNPDDVEKYFSTHDIKYVVLAPPKKVNNPEDGKEIYSEAYIQLKSFNKGSTVASLTTSKLFVKLYPSTVTRLAADDKSAMSTTLELKDGSARIAGEITAFAKNYQLKDYANLPEKFRNDLMYGLDSTIRSLLIKKLEQTFLPTYDETNKVFYETLGQQLKYLNDSYNELNDAIIDKVKAYSSANIIDTNIQKDFPTIKLGNFTITLNYSS